MPKKITEAGPGREIRRLQYTVDRLRTALEQCANLTRYQHLSPSTVEAVGKRVGEIARKATQEDRS